MHGLYAWLRRHPRLVDGGLALLLLVSGVNLTRPHFSDLVTGPLAVGMIVPIVFRRAYPTAAFAAVIADGALQVVITRRPMGADFAVLIMLYTLAAYRPRRTSVRGLLICLLGAVTAVVDWHPPHLGPDPLYRIGTEATVLIAPLLLAWLLGDSLRWRRGYYQALEERARRLERERDALAQVAAAAERARIAREMHDVVAHHVSVMVVQADGAAFALDHAPDQARNALDAISKTGRQALAEMRRLLGVLRTADAGPAELGPMPGLSVLDELAEQTRAGGIPVGVTIDGPPRPLADGADLAAYRVIQESLTNVRKHGGPGVSAFVTVRYEPDWLTIRVTDDGRGAAAGSDGAGHGLAGMRERVELYGGTVAAGPRLGGGYEVTALLPYVPSPAREPARAGVGSAA